MIVTCPGNHIYDAGVQSESCPHYPLDAGPNAFCKTHNLFRPCSECREERGIRPIQSDADRQRYPLAPTTNFISYVQCQDSAGDSWIVRWANQAKTVEEAQEKAIANVGATGGGLLTDGIILSIETVSEADVSRKVGKLP